MDIYCDSSINEACIVIDWPDPFWWVIPYENTVTNNIGEYRAVIAASKFALNHGYRDVKIMTDSLLVVNQVTGLWKCKKKHLEELMFQARLYVSAIAKRENKKLSDILQWIHREENLAGRALDGH